MNDERYARQTALPEIGPTGQAMIERGSVLIVGLGGLGAPAATYLTGAGVGRIGLCDPDTVSLSNLQRQVLYTEAEVGLAKVDCAARRLAAISGHTVFEKYPDGITPENAREIIGAYDIVVDCCDNFATRYLIDDVCAELGKVWVYGSIGAFSGQAAVMNGAHGLRYNYLYPDREELEGQPAASGGVLGIVPGVIGAIEAGEALKLLGQFGEPLDGKLYVIDLKTLNTNILQF